VRPFILVF